MTTKNASAIQTVPGTSIKLGTTLYSFTNEWVARVYSLETLVAEVAAAGIGPGVEIVGFQSIRTFPTVDQSFVRDWRNLLEKYGLVGSCLGSNIDVALRSDRNLSSDEMVDYLSNQIVSARELGFPILRIQMGATSEVIERVTPLAEKSGVTLGMEIHAPEGGRTAEVQRVAATYKRIGSENLGFIPDFSSTMHAVPSGMLESFERAGSTPKLMGRLTTIWETEGHPQQRYQTWVAEARDAGLSEDAIRAVQIGFSMFGHESVESWSDIADSIVHVHGKFYELDANGDEPNIDYRALMAMLVNANYDGFISSEWEGHSFRDLGDVDTIDLVKRHHALETREIEKAAAGE